MFIFVDIYFVFKVNSLFSVFNTSGCSFIVTFSGISVFAIFKVVVVLYCALIFDAICPLYIPSELAFDSVVTIPFGSLFSIPFVYLAVYFVPLLCTVISEFEFISILLASTFLSYI